MTKLSKAARKSLVANTIKVNGNREITPPKDKILRDNDIDSTLSLVDGGMVVDQETGYSTQITPTDPKAFPTKKYVDDITSEIVDNGLQVDGSNSMEADLNMGGNAIKDVTRLQKDVTDGEVGVELSDSSSYLFAYGLGSNFTEVVANKDGGFDVFFTSGSGSGAMSLAPDRFFITNKNANTGILNFENLDATREYLFKNNNGTILVDEFKTDEEIFSDTGTSVLTSIRPHKSYAAYGPSWNNLITYVLGDTGTNIDDAELITGLYQSPSQTIIAAHDNPLGIFARLDVNKDQGIGVFSGGSNYAYLRTDDLTGLVTLQLPNETGKLVTKYYVDNLIEGLDWKLKADVRTTANITLSGIQTIDGRTGADGRRVLVMNQSDTTENGLYVMRSGAWERTYDGNTGDELVFAVVQVVNGSAHAGKVYRCDQAFIDLGVTGISFSQWDLAAYTNGTGLQLVGNQFSIDSTVATLTGSQILTNKTLTSPVINVGSDATGDMYYRNSGGNFTRIPVTSNGQVLVLAGGIPSWSLSMGAITPTSVNSLTLARTGTRITTGLSITMGSGSIRDTAFGSTIQLGNQDTTAVGSSINIPMGVNGAVMVGSLLNETSLTSKARMFLYGVNLQPGNAGNLLLGTNIGTNAENVIILNPSNTTFTSYAGGGYIGIGRTTATGDLSGNVQIGDQGIMADGENHSIQIGQLGKVFLDPTYGSAGGEQTQIGYKGITGSWRTTATGAYTQALAVSSSAWSYGAYVNAPHSDAKGRGAYLITGAATLIYNGNNNNTLFVGGAYGSWTNPTIPETVDFSTAQNAGTRIATITTNSGIDVKPTPTLTNVRGAILNLQGGLSTGTASGGKVTISTSPASGSSNNTLNTSVVCAEFDAASTGGSEDTRFALLDLTDGTLKRVSFGSDDSGGVGFKVLRVSN